MPSTSTRQPIRPLPEFSGILREDEFFATGDADDTADRINGWFDRLMVQSGVEVPPSVLLSLCVLCAVTLAGTVFVVQENLLTAALAALIGTLIPIGVVLVIRARRQAQMLRQMPGMVGELARAARTGRNLEHCFQMVAQDTPLPLGKELRHCARKVEMGVGLSEALQGLPERTGLVSLSVLVTALAVHQQTGGDLVKVLERLAQTVRDRLAFLGRLRAATATSRATAILMVLLPPGILAFFIFRDPAYLGNLMASSWSRGMTLMAVVLQIIGAAWVFRILKSSQRT